MNDKNPKYAVGQKLLTRQEGAMVEVSTVFYPCSTNPTEDILYEVEAVEPTLIDDNPFYLESALYHHDIVDLSPGNTPTPSTLDEAIRLSKIKWDILLSYLNSPNTTCLKLVREKANQTCAMCKYQRRFRTNSQKSICARCPLGQSGADYSKSFCMSISDDLDECTRLDNAKELCQKMRDRLDKIDTSFSPSSSYLETKLPNFALDDITIVESESQWESLVEELEKRKASNTYWEVLAYTTVDDTSFTPYRLSGRHVSNMSWSRVGNPIKTWDTRFSLSEAFQVLSNTQDYIESPKFEVVIIKSHEAFTALLDRLPIPADPETPLLPGDN